MTGRPRPARLATFQVAVTIHRETPKGGVVPAKQPPTVDRMEKLIQEALVREGYPAHRVSAMRTDI